MFCVDKLLLVNKIVWERISDIVLPGNCFLVRAVRKRKCVVSLLLLRSMQLP
jgi:hypothetical protein